MTSTLHDLLQLIHSKDRLYVLHFADQNKNLLVTALQEKGALYTALLTPSKQDELVCIKQSQAF